MALPARAEAGPASALARGGWQCMASSRSFSRRGGGRWTASLGVRGTKRPCCAVGPGLGDAVPCFACERWSGRAVMLCALRHAGCCPGRVRHSDPSAHLAKVIKSVIMTFGRATGTTKILVSMLYVVYFCLLYNIICKSAC